MQNAFKNMASLAGGVRIENSNLSRLSIFTPGKKEGYFSFYCETYGVYITNNSNLIDASDLWQTYPLYDNKENKECDFRIENNPKLNASYLCDFGTFWQFMDLKVKGNEEDCGCQGDEITAASLPGYKNSQVLYRGLKLQNITDSADYSYLSNIQTIKGTIDIRNTNLQNLSFLESFRSLKINNLGSVLKMSFNLQDNSQMTRLALPVFKRVENIEFGHLQLFNFENLHPDFCLTYEEILLFFDNYVSFTNLHAKICEDSVLEFPKSYVEDLRICHFESMNKLPNDCGAIIGDVIVDAGDELNIKKIDELVYLFGSLAIQNTALTTVDQFHKLKYIVHLGSGPVIQVTSNRQLTKFTYMYNSLTYLYTRSEKNREAVFQDNHPNITNAFGVEYKDEFHWRGLW
ncbi:unnamed protein product [Caenorhabditis brenneri]